MLVMYTVNNSEQLRELSSNDLNFLENDDPIIESENGNSNSTVRDLDNILDKFEADTQILLDNPNQLLNCKYTHTNLTRKTFELSSTSCIHPAIYLSIF